MVTLGVGCGIAYDFFFYDDLFFECVKASHDFDKIVDEFGIVGVGLACRESVLFEIGSILSQVIPTVGITTNDYWLSGSDGDCFSQELAAAPQSSLVPTPSESPTTSFPTVASDAPPTMKRSESPNTVPTVPPTAKRSESPSTVPTVPFNNDTASVPTFVLSKNNSSGVVFGVVAGAIVIAIAVMMAIACLVFRNKQTASASPKDVVTNRRPSETDSTSVVLNDPAPTSLIPVMAQVYPSSNQSVYFKDQVRTVLDPTYPAREHTPDVIALIRQASSGRSQSSTADPSGCRLDNEDYNER
jgi:hypothetical protein